MSAPETPLFSVLMPAYNAEETISAAIESVLAQTVPWFELLIVDDGSTDMTVRRAEGYTSDSRVRLLATERKGPAGARNAAIHGARGNYMSLLDSDDLWLPTYLERMGSVLSEDLGAGFAYPDAWVLDDSSRRVRKALAMAAERPPRPTPYAARDFLLELLKRNFVYVGATIRRSVVEQVGLFERRFAPAEDYELWLRIVAAGFRAVHVPEPLCIYRRRKGSLSSDPIRLFDALREVFTQIVSEWELSEDARAIAESRLVEISAQLTAETSPRLYRRLWRSARRRRGGAYVRFFGRWRWHRAIPDQIAQTFPNLRDL